MSMFNVALVGNPNAGKSTIFSALTGERQHVANWPGKTVEKKEGVFSVGGVSINVIDLPGTYSLSAYSLEETITRDYLVYEHPDGVVAVVDAANLERNLYLVVQIIELGTRLLVVLNMTDVAAARGLTIDLPRLSARLGVPVLAAVATQGKGIDQIKMAILDLVGAASARAAGK